MKTLILCFVFLVVLASAVFAETLFKNGEKVITTQEYTKKANSGAFGEDNKPVRYGTVLDEDKNGTVTIYDPVTKRNTQIYRSYLILRRELP